MGAAASTEGPWADRADRNWRNGDREAAWSNARQVAGRDPNRWREDAYGAPMYYHNYGQRTNMGWDIDHRREITRGGTNAYSNLQAMQWHNNRVVKNRELRARARPWWEL